MLIQYSYRNRRYATSMPKHLFAKFAKQFYKLHKIEYNMLTGAPKLHLLEKLQTSLIADALSSAMYPSLRESTILDNMMTDDEYIAWSLYLAKKNGSEFTLTGNNANKMVDLLQPFLRDHHRSVLGGPITDDNDYFIVN